MDNLRESIALLCDPARCVHIGDRGSDIYELFCEERGKSKGRDPIEWKLVTDLPVTSRASAIEKLRCYALRCESTVNKTGGRCCGQAMNV
jgi:hypothetical protein